LITRQQIPENALTENKYTTAILQKLSDGNNIDNIPDVITFEELYSAMNKWNERTTTSPSGPYLGHYKILQRLPVYEENIPNINISMKIFNVYYQVISIATKLGRTLSRWCNVTTCMIEKIKGSTKVDKLRVIHLYEADYNIIQKNIWARKTIWKAHNSDRLHEGRAGSRPNQRAIDVVIKKEMKYEHTKLTRTNMGSIGNDAKSCFDRILCNLAMLVSRYHVCRTIFVKHKQQHYKTLFLN
jgi:hypothetical protein